MARTGCAFAAVTCLCCPARTHRDRQVLPAYGLQDLPIKTQNPSRGSKPNTMWMPITLGESLGRGHFYLAETRTFLLCVDTNLPPQNMPPAEITRYNSRDCRKLAALHHQENDLAPVMDCHLFSNFLSQRQSIS